ncbi:MAG: FAD-dependent oxidoreductase, partial [Myxococcales bacterium]|nr:FAD-dependent oxidoreductase [Myxococcales bacterium]
FGFYENALGMMREVYRELGRAPGTPLATFKEAFRPGSALHLAGSTLGRAPVWPLALPRNDEAPGDGLPLPTIWSYVGQILAWVIDSLPDLHERMNSYAALIGAWDRGAREILAGLIERAQRKGIPFFGEEAITAAAIDGELLRRAAAVGPTIDHELGDDHQRCRVWAAPLLFVAEECISQLLSDPDHIQYPLFLGPLQLGLGLVRGILGDRLYTPGRGLEAIQGEEFREWLTRHGAPSTLLEHPLIGALYAAFFAFEEGDTKRPAIAAGTMTQLVLRLFFTYRGALYYTPTAGTGEVVFAPLYQLLRRRGVRFRFFHKVKALHVADNEDAIEAITISRQVALKRRRGYDPLVAVKGLPCWPAAPRWEQIVLGHEPTVQAMNFEVDDSPEVDAIRLRRGRDFDRVILGIPPGGLAKVCRSLAKRAPRWEAMLTNLRTVAVGGVQLWVYSKWNELTGDPEPPLAGSNFPAPFVSWTNASSTITYELWTGNFWPGSVAKLDATIPEAVLELADAEPEARRAAADRWLRAQAKRWLSSHTRILWPEGTAGFTNGIDWSLLVDPERRMGEARIDGQHVWATSDGGGRQILSLPGTDRYRLRADASGFSNLVLAGDWTDTGLNLGCIEAAVISGRQAARAIHGRPEVIIGESQVDEALVVPSPTPASAASRGSETVKIAALN